jgi:3'-phosphoadenosine 5'-phosphosulfate sulfotransferase (PAPS reductase)/FAD synthetase
MKNILSLGGGVQSSALYLMSLKGLINIDLAIFADTGNETKKTYEYIRYLQSFNQGNIVVIKERDIIDDIKNQISKKEKLIYSPPFWIRNADGQHGFLRQQCTENYKIKPIRRYLKSKYPKESYNLIIGISLDEIHRVKPSRIKSVNHIYPLIEKRFKRNDCLKWIKENNYLLPSKSGCIICPYASEKNYKELDSQEKQFLIEFDELIRDGHYKPNDQYYINSKFIPISRIVNNIDSQDDLDFGGCDSGHCFL